MTENNWHAMSTDEVLAALGASRQGLSKSEAARRMEQYGPNQIQERIQTAWYQTLFAQIKNPLIYILLVAVAISFAVRHYGDGAVILAVVLINTIIGFIQEYRAERAMAELAKLAAPQATVRREGNDTEVPTAELVPGDVVVLAAGDRVPADARLLAVYSLEADESALTGESTPVTKSTEPLPEKTPVADRENMVFAGTVVTRGRGEAVITSTGHNTQFGKIAEDVLGEQRQETPLQKQLYTLGRRLGVVALALAGLVFIGGILRGSDLLDMFLFAIAAAVAAVPEGLPAVVTVALAIGMKSMAQKNAIIRRLPAVEALGSATVIVSDKTGTLTQNKMTAKAAHLPGAGKEITIKDIGKNGEATLLLTAAALANDAQLVESDGGAKSEGDPTETALVMAAAEAGLPKPELEARCARIGEVPFESERGYMATLHKCPDGTFIYMKGAPEAIIKRADRARVGGNDVDMTDELRSDLIRANENMANKALRVLAMAYKQVDNDKTEVTDEDLSGGFTHLGLIGMIDPPRPEAIEAVEKCRSAGIKVIMATGDNKNTAKAIAEDFNLITEESLVVDGAELDRMSDQELTQKLDRIAVFARVDPEDKLRVVKTLKELGQVVAVTGDGVNDAPALKKADIGVAMGVTGTGVAQEAGDMVLADDNFATIVRAVEEGRIVFGRIRKVVSYLIATNAGEILTIAIAVAAGLPRPLTAVQLLWVNLITDSGPSLALATDPPSINVLERPPRSANESVIDRRVLNHLVLVAPVMAIVTLIAFFIGYGDTRDHILGHTMAFVTLSIAQLFNAINVRSEHKSAFTISPWSNPWLIAAIFAALLLQVLPVELEVLQRAFDTTRLTLAQWGIVIALASSVLWTEELRKLIARLRGAG